MCGIVGFSGFKNDDGTNNHYDPEKIKFLMYYNSVERDSKDSIGFYKRGNHTPIKSTGSPKLFLTSKSTLKLIDESSDVFIGHVRKKSVGVLSEANAHPYRINNIIGVHNGTISNIETLCKKLRINFVKDRTDSLNLFRCIAESGDATPLKYAEGPCTVVFTDLMDDEEIYVYSKERELYYGTIDGIGMYISSENWALESIGCAKYEKFVEGSLYTIKNGIITDTVKIEPGSSKVKNSSDEYRYVTDRWIRAKNDIPDLGIIKGEFYFVCKTNYSSSKPKTIDLNDGSLSKTPFKIKSDSPILGVDISNFETPASLEYYQITKAKPLLMKVQQTFKLDNGQFVEKGDYFIAYEHFPNGSVFNGYWIEGDTNVTRVIGRNLRIVTQEEFTYYNKSLLSVTELLDDDHLLNKVKFTTSVYEAPKLESFMETCYQNLNVLRESIENSKSIKGDEKTQFQNNINSILNEIESYNNIVLTN